MIVAARIGQVTQGELRDILAHEYFGVDQKIVWDVVRAKIPQLLRQVRRILAAE